MIPTVSSLNHKCLPQNGTAAHYINPYTTAHEGMHGLMNPHHGVELTILETALIYGFRRLADDNTRMEVLDVLERVTSAPLLADDGDSIQK